MYIFTKTIEYTGKQNDRQPSKALSCNFNRILELQNGLRFDKFSSAPKLAFLGFVDLRVNLQASVMARTPNLTTLHHVHIGFAKRFTYSVFI